MSETQFLSLRDQLQALSESSNLEHLPSPLLSSVEVVDAEPTVVIEGLRGKMKGLEQTIVTERNTVKGLRDMVVGLSEKVVDLILAGQYLENVLISLGNVM